MNAKGGIVWIGDESWSTSSRSTASYNNWRNALEYHVAYVLCLEHRPDLKPSSILDADTHFDRLCDLLITLTEPLGMKYSSFVTAEMYRAFLTAQEQVHDPNPIGALHVGTDLENVRLCYQRCVIVRDTMATCVSG